MCSALCDACHQIAGHSGVHVAQGSSTMPLLRHEAKQGVPLCILIECSTILHSKDGATCHAAAYLCQRAVPYYDLAKLTALQQIARHSDAHNSQSDEAHSLWSHFCTIVDRQQRTEVKGSAVVATFRPFNLYHVLSSNACGSMTVEPLTAPESRIRARGNAIQSKRSRDSCIM